MRNIKMLGLLAIAAMALVAFVGTSAASATEKFTAGEAGETISENTTKEHVFTITGTEVNCANAEFKGTTTGTEASTQEVSPTYTECEAFGLGPESAKVTTNNCEFVFAAATSGTPGHANVTLQGCDDKTKGIQIEANVTPFAHCVVDVPEQTISTAVRYSDPAVGTIRVDATAKNIMADVTVSQGFCPLTTGTHEGANGGTYTGQSDITTANGITYSP